MCTSQTITVITITCYPVNSGVDKPTRFDKFHPTFTLTDLLHVARKCFNGLVFPFLCQITKYSLSFKCRFFLYSPPCADPEFFFNLGWGGWGSKGHLRSFYYVHLKKISTPSFRPLRSAIAFPSLHTLINVPEQSYIII